MSASDLHDRSPEAVRERLAYWQQRGRVERTERRAASRVASTAAKARATPVGRVASTAAKALRPDLGKLVRHPAQHAREKPAATAFALFLVLVTIAVLRRGALPDQRGVIAIGGAAFAVVVAATFLPDLTVAALVVGLVVSSVESAGVIGQVVSAGTSRLQSALGKAA
ncbi:MAG: hypothetical protein KGK34_07240 [Chloroflexota bacterium]|nr:hypothetical protein [Chloroflexota bacterium]